MNNLPTEFGTVVGWAKYYKGQIQYYSAVLGRGITGKEYVWWASGEEDPYSPDELVKEFGADFVVIGFIEVDAEALDKATVLDRELNKD